MVLHYQIFGPNRSLVWLQYFDKKQVIITTTFSKSLFDQTFDSLILALSKWLEDVQPYCLVLLTTQEANTNNLKEVILFAYILILETKDDWDFRISDLVKNPDGTDI